MGGHGRPPSIDVGRQLRHQVEWLTGEVERLRERVNALVPEWHDATVELLDPEGRPASTRVPVQYAVLEKSGQILVEPDAVDVPLALRESTRIVSAQFRTPDGAPMWRVRFDYPPRVHPEDTFRATFSVSCS